MTVTSYRLLEFIVGRYDTRERPVTPAEVADRFELQPASVADRFERFRECSLLVRVGEEGYRPTVTARELLQLDVDGEFLIIDADPDR